MLLSDAYPFNYKGKPAQLYVLRNDGFCWGRLVTEAGGEFDVNPAADQYERTDDDAAATMIRVAQRGKVEAPCGWVGVIAYHSPQPEAAR